jgi:hypothetical protein
MTGLGDGGALMGVADQLPGGRFGAWLDEEGNLFVDPAHVEIMERAVRRDLGPESLGAIEEVRLERCAALSGATEEAVRAASDPSQTEVVAQLCDLGTQISGVFPYAVLTKFVPGLLQQALADAGYERPLAIPSPSSGALLSRDLLALHLDCLGRGYPAERLRAHWPDVDAELHAAVEGFCSRHAGFGPVAWEAPGYETPSFVFDAIRAAFGGADPEALRARSGEVAPGREAVSDEGTDWVVQLRRALASWLDFMDREIWFVRSAFYRGVVPLLRTLSGQVREQRSELRPDDLLFVRIGELDSALPDRSVIEDRRRRYMADRAYLGRNGIEPSRLVFVMEPR